MERDRSKVTESARSKVEIRGIREDWMQCMETVDNKAGSGSERQKILGR